MFDAWNNAPWTPRGLKFKDTVESLLAVSTFFLILGICGHFE